MGPNVDDDWEMDDWEDETFDEDVYDHSELSLTAAVDTSSFDDNTEEEPADEPWSAASPMEYHEDLELFDGGGSVTAEAVVSADTGGGRVGWSAWEVGTVFALGGWLADHHAEHTAQQIASALAEHNVGRPATGSPLGASHPPPPSDYPYRDTAGTLTVEDAVDPGVLFAQLIAAKARGQDLMLQAEGPIDIGRPLVLVISAVPTSSGPRFWVVAELQHGGFSPARLIPVFEHSTDSGVAIFATDHATEAVDAALWACQREGLTLYDFHITHKQPS